MDRSELLAIYEQMDLLLKNLEKRNPLNAKIGQALVYDQSPVLELTERR